MTSAMLTAIGNTLAAQETYTYDMLTDHYLPGFAAQDTKRKGVVTPAMLTAIANSSSQIDLRT
jgi:hypothetical protein